MKAVIVPAKGGPTIVDFNKGDSYDLIQNSVGGTFDCIRLHSIGADMWIHDEGKIIGLPVNSLASMLWFQEYGFSDVIAGDALITGGTDEEGNTLGLTEKEANDVIDTMYGMNSALVLKVALSESMRFEDSYV